MAQALLLPLLEQNDPAAADVIAVVGQQATADRLAASLPGDLTLVSASDSRAAAAWTAPVQLLAIKPYQLDQVAASVPAVQGPEPPLLISVLAGITLERWNSPSLGVSVFGPCPTPHLWCGQVSPVWPGARG